MDGEILLWLLGAGAVVLGVLGYLAHRGIIGWSWVAGAAAGLLSAAGAVAASKRGQTQPQRAPADPVPMPPAPPDPRDVIAPVLAVADDQTQRDLDAIADAESDPDPGERLQRLADLGNARAAAGSKSDRSGGS